MRTTAMLLWGALTRQQSNFVSRTVMVKENNVEEAMKVLNGIVANEGIIQRWKITRRYEKPTWYRNRINYERSRAVYVEDMNNRLNFVLRKNRRNPYPGVD